MALSFCRCHYPTRLQFFVFGLSRSSIGTTTLDRGAPFSTLDDYPAVLFTEILLLSDEVDLVDAMLHTVGRREFIR